MTKPSNQPLDLDRKIQEFITKMVIFMKDSVWKENLLGRAKEDILTLIALSFMRVISKTTSFKEKEDKFSSLNIS